MSEAAALGFRAHSGWTAVVAVAGSLSKPVVLERRQIATADAAIPGSKQPYHAAERLDLPKAEALIRLCRDRSTLLATSAMSELIAQLAEKGHRVVGTGVLFGSARPLPGLAAILQSHVLLHSAEGEFFREVLADASAHCSLPVYKIREREVWDRAAVVLRLPSATLQQRLNELGRPLGPPWRQDQKLATLTAWIALAETQAEEKTPSL